LTCAPDSRGGPVSMTTGNMQFGPIELVSISTPSGTPLRLALTYNSRLQGDSPFGKGWRLNLEGARREQSAALPFRLCHRILSPGALVL
jgi:hypothetical protein